MLKLARVTADSTERHTTDAWRQPARWLALAGWALAVGLMLTVIASVALQQRERGHSFEYADLPAQAAPSAPYAMRGTRLADLYVIDTNGQVPADPPR